MNNLFLQPSAFEKIIIFSFNFALLVVEVMSKQDLESTLV